MYKRQNEDTFLWLREQVKKEKVVAVGEIGLDYYWDKEEEVQKNQRIWFRRQLELAKESNLPVIIHSRDAAADTMEIMKEAHVQGIKGVIHCFSYSKEQAQEYVKMGYYIGVGGVATFKNAKKLKEVIETIPLEKILLETDCPYMAPEPYRGKRNSSLYLPYVVEKIAGLKGVTAKEVEEVTYRNAEQLFLGKSVSYTHLDVYKRQIRRGVVLFKREGGYLFDILCRIRRVLCRIGNGVAAAQIEPHGF